MSIVCCAGFILLLAVANYLLHRDVLYPAFLQACLWLFATVLFFITHQMFIPVSGSTFALFVAGVAVFSIGAFVASYDHRPVLARNRLLEGSTPTKSAVLLFAAVVAIGLVLYVNKAARLASSGPFTNPYINLRYALSVTWEETGGDLGVLSYFIPCAYTLAGITVLNRRGFERSRSSRFLVATAVISGLAFGVLSSGRGVVLPLIIILLAIPTTLRVTTALKTAATLGVLALGVFVLLGLALGKGGTFTSSFGENLLGMRDSFVTYFVGGIPSLDTFIREQGRHLELGANTFRTILAILRGLGFGTPYIPLVQPYVDIPMPLNVYTVYQPYVKDFGTAGLLMLFPIGFAHGFLYRKATVRHPHAAFVFLFALSLYPLAMQAFQDMYFSALSTWIQYLAISVVLFGICTNHGLKYALPAVHRVA
jgi:oligosaccharide repeat unit polymerase